MKFRYKVVAECTFEITGADSTPEEALERAKDTISGFINNGQLKLSDFDFRVIDNWRV